MGNSDGWKPSSRQPGGTPAPAGSAAPDSKPAPSADEASKGKAGRIVHDERGNAVWDWLKDTARIAIDSTSRLLMKLEVPGLQVEDTQEQPLRMESERDSGGGYDPYGGAGATSKASDEAGSRRGTFGNQSATGGTRSGTSNNAGGGYDPYGKGIITKPTRKP